MSKLLNTTVIIFFLAGCFSGALIFASTFGPKVEQFLRNESKSPYLLNEYVNTSEWKTYSNPAYGYSFRYPVSWTLIEPKNTNSDYLKRKWVRIVSPNNPRSHGVIGSTEYTINIESLSGFPALPFIRNIEDLMETLENGQKEIPAKLARLSPVDGLTRIILSKIYDDPNFILAFVFEKQEVFQIILGPGFLEAHTSDDIAAFNGILSTFITN